MPALSFQKQFVPFVEDGSKQHSIRADRKRPFKVGDTLSLFYGMRTKQCRLLARVPCIKVERMRIERARVWIYAVELSLDEKDLLAWTDGFRHTPDYGQSFYKIPSGCICQGDGLLGMKCDAETHAVAWNTVTEGCFELMLSYWTKQPGGTSFEGQIVHWDWSEREVADQGGKR
jgi:hypothetical protein